MTGREGVYGYTGRAVHGVHPPGVPLLVHAHRRDQGRHRRLRRLAGSAECASGSADTVEKYGAETGLEVGYENNELAFGLPNGIGPEVTAMKEAGVDFVMGCLDLNGMKTLAQELERQGMADVPMFHPNTYDAAFVAEAGEAVRGRLRRGHVPGVRGRPRRAASWPSSRSGWARPARRSASWR